MTVEFDIIQTAAKTFKKLIASRDMHSPDTETWYKLNEIAETVIPERMTKEELVKFNELINS